MSLSRRLPADCTVRRATAANARRVAHLLGAPDREEMEALEGCPALEVLHGWMTSTPRVLTNHGQPVVIYGIAAATSCARAGSRPSCGRPLPFELYHRVRRAALH